MKKRTQRDLAIEAAATRIQQIITPKLSYEQIRSRCETEANAGSGYYTLYFDKSAIIKVTLINKSTFQFELL